MSDELGEILKLDNFAFVEAVYKRVLRREADSVGREANLARLSNGVDRCVIALEITRSVEALQYANELQGWRAALEAQVSRRLFSIRLRSAYMRLKGLPVGVLRRFRPRARLLALARTVKAVGIRALGVKRQRHVVVLSRSLYDAIDVPPSLSASEADVYRQLVLHLSSRSDAKQ